MAQQNASYLSVKMHRNGSSDYPAWSRTYFAPNNRASDFILAFVAANNSATELFTLATGLRSYPPR